MTSSQCRRPLPPTPALRRSRQGHPQHDQSQSLPVNTRLTRSVAQTAGHRLCPVPAPPPPPPPHKHNGPWLTVVQERALGLFKQLDLNEDGIISRGELAAGIRTIDALAGLLGLPDGCTKGPASAQFNELCTEMDASGMGRIRLAEFCSRMKLVADSMPRVVLDWEVSKDGKVEVKLSEEVPHISVDCEVALDGSVRVSLDQGSVEK